MLNPMVSLLVFQSEMLIAYLFFNNVSPRKRPRRVCLLVGFVLFSIASAANIFSGNNIFCNILIFNAISILFPLICFDLPVRQSIFYAVSLVIIATSFEFFMIALVSALTQSAWKSYNNSFAIFVLECPTSKLLYFIAAYFLSHKVKSTGNKAAMPLSMLVYPLTALVCNLTFWAVAGSAQISYDMQNIMAMSCMMFLFSTIFIFINYQHQLEKENEYLQMRSQYSRLVIEKSYYDILEQQNRQLMIYAHDAKNHLVAIQNLNNDPRIDGYISALSQQLAEYTRNCHSGNKLLDVMIDKFTLDCRRRGIFFEYDVKLCNLSGIGDMDLVAILGNLMDNAVSAAEKSTEKKVSLATAKRNGYDILIITNSCDIPPKANGDRLVTSKDDYSVHGFGLKSVSQTLVKYQGDFEWDYDASEKTFTVTAMIGAAEE